MKPALRTGLRPVWRDPETIQIGIDPRRAVALTAMSEAAVVIGLLDGSRDRAQAVTEASRHGVPEAVTERVLALLAAAGALIDFPAGLLSSLPPELRARLRPELAAASVAGQDGDGGATLLARRADAKVTVCGDGPVAATLAALLTGSGLAAHAEPLADPARLGHRPDLIVLVGHQTPDRGLQLVRQGIPHLGVAADEAIGVVGPLVRPGVSACLRCLDLTRTDNDPAWPVVLAQRSRPDHPAACDHVLATAVAAQAAAHVVAFADRAPLALALSNGVIELIKPAWQWRRTTWRPHPACVCGAAGRTGSPSTSTAPTRSRL